MLHPRWTLPWVRVSHSLRMALDVLVCSATSLSASAARGTRAPQSAILGRQWPATGKLPVAKGEQAHLRESIIRQLPLFSPFNRRRTNVNNSSTWPALFSLAL